MRELLEEFPASGCPLPTRHVALAKDTGAAKLVGETSFKDIPRWDRGGKVKGTWKKHMDNSKCLGWLRFKLRDHMQVCTLYTQVNRIDPRVSNHYLGGS